MRVAFVSGNRELLPDAAIPIGILSVVANVPGRHEKAFIDLCFEDEPFEVLAQRLRDFEPEVVALGMRNIQSADYSGTSNTLDYYTGLIDTIRSVTEAPIAIGGSGFSVMPAQLMERLRPDYGISGEAEEAFPALLDGLERAAGLDGIGNLHRFKNGELVSNGPPARFLDMDTLSPADRSLVDSRYYERFGIESLQTKRGCPLRCDYCTYPLIEGRVGRVREPSSVVDELFMSLEQQPGTTHVFMVDSVFNLPRSHAKAVCREMIDRGVTIPWTCYANPLGFDAELAELMARAGCAGMEVGADAGADEILARLRKGFTTDEIRHLHQLAEQVGIPDCHTFILGTPG
ncbi:MAG: radical SAM protein, partial [Deltaproteobacteria bacterium]|nr:radical SAM protein [Deltaproteobacteria bacterium]